MPNSNKPVVIAGAGPAGSTLAIRLRHLGLPVTLTDLDMALAETFEEVFGAVTPSAAA